MQILIANQSSEPLYAQIARQIRQAVLRGELPPGEPMPSIRHLAGELRVSVITAKRAYDDLEGEGFLVTSPGRGTFVSQADSTRLREVALCQLEEQLSVAVDEAWALGISQEELLETVRTLYEEEEKRASNSIK